MEAILEGLQWAGLLPEEGVVLRNGAVLQEGSKGPYFQSERLELYKKYADELVHKGFAYPCFCTQERLEQMRKDQETRHQAPMYDRLCCRLSKEEASARIAAGERHVIRMKIPHEETISYEDDIRGLVSFKGHTVDDQVLIKGDGFPTYHMAHVVDDHFMEIDLVLRGEEWLASVPKHLLLFRFLEWAPPRYAHVPLILNKDRSKLSKRQNSVAVSDYITKGYLPEALLNFLALLGWNPGTEEEVLSVNELVDKFTLERVQKAGAVFDEEKLQWLQGQWMRKMDKSVFAKRVQELVPESKDDAHFARKAELIQDRITFLHEAPAMIKFFYERPTASMELIANAKQKVTPEMIPEILSVLESVLSGISESDWNDQNILAAVKGALGDKWKLGQLLWPLRSVLTGQEYSPGATEVAGVLGKTETLERLAAAKK